MSYTLFCDICNTPIKEGENRSTLTINTIKQNAENSTKSYITLEELENYLKKSKENIKIYDICDNCKIVLEHFLNLRISEVKKIQEELNKLEDSNDR